MNAINNRRGEGESKWGDAQGGMRGVQEGARKEMGRRMSKGMGGGGILAPLVCPPPPPQPHCMNGAVCIPHAALFSLTSPLIHPFIIITYYITCIIRYEYNFVFFYILFQL